MAENIYNRTTTTNVHELEPLNIQNNKNKAGPIFGKRHIELLNVFTCLLIGYCIKMNFSLTIVAMTDPLANENKDIPTFNWRNKNVIIASFFVGYILPQVPAGWLMTKYGPKWFLIATMGVCAITGFLIPPLAVYFGSTAVIVCRIIQGITQGFFIPAIPCFISRWIPLTERGRFGTFLYASGPLGAVLSMFLSGAIAASPYGWPMTFHFFSAIALLWCVYYTFCGHNSPLEHKSITEAEKKYIQETSINENTKRLPTPWKHLAKSKPAWALLYSLTCVVFGWWVLMSQIPTYMSKIMRVNLQSNGALTAIMFLTQWAVGILLGVASDFVINRSILSRSAVRKLVAAIGSIGPTISILLLTKCEDGDFTKGVALLMVGFGTGGAVVSSLAINSVDLSVNHSGIIQGMVNAFSHIFACLAPLVVQFLVDDEYNRDQWKVVFYLTSAVTASSGVVFVIFGSGKSQPWNDLEQEGSQEA